jgi:ribosome biogenesis GTPase / thiamine phosphate phosphatase
LSSYGTIIAAYGRQFVVRPDVDEQADVPCVTRGKQVDYCVGDRVEFALTGDNTGVINQLQERKSIVKRSDHRKTKLLAANVTQIWYVIATEPSVDENLLGRVLLCAAEANLPITLLVNKTELAGALANLKVRLQVYEALGYPMQLISVKTAPEKTRLLLAPLLQGQTTLVMGQSGVGKSTLINCLVPHAAQATAGISIALSSGKHTTTFSKAFSVGEQSWVIDTPGFQEFGLGHLHPSQVQHGMPEFAARLGQCQFADCQHKQEPGCAIQEALKTRQVDPRRLALFHGLLSDLAYYERAKW